MFCSTTPAVPPTPFELRSRLPSVRHADSSRAAGPSPHYHRHEFTTFARRAIADRCRVALKERKRTFETPRHTGRCLYHCAVRGVQSSHGVRKRDQPHGGEDSGKDAYAMRTRRSIRASDATRPYVHYCRQRPRDIASKRTHIAACRGAQATRAARDMRSA